VATVNFYALDLVIGSNSLPVHELRTDVDAD